MNKEAVNDSFLLFQDTGYNGTIEDFTKLISTNDEALADAYGLFTNTGYNGTQDDFNKLVGVKKKDATKASASASEGGPEGTTSVTEEVATTTPSGSLAGEETEVVEQTTVTETDKCPPGQVRHPDTGECVNLSVLETTPIDQDKTFTIGEVVEHEQDQKTGEIIYPKGITGPKCKTHFVWNGKYCQLETEIQEEFNTLSPSQKEVFIKDKEIDDQTAKDLFNVSFQEEKPKNLSPEDDIKYQEQLASHKQEETKTLPQEEAVKVRDRINKSLKDELDIDLPYAVNEFITDINYNRPPTDMLTGELPKTHPSGAQMIWTGPSTIGEKIINADEEQVEIALSEIYGGWGFTFEQTGLGDAIIVTSNNQEDLNRSTLKNMTSSEQQDYKLKNGISVEIDLQSFTEEGAKKEVEKLKNFIDGNYNKTGYVDSTLDDIYQAAKKGDHKKFRRIYNEDVIENEIGKLKELDKELTASIPQYEQDYFQWNQRFDAYDKQLFDLESKIEAFDKNVDSIGLAVESGTVLYEEAEKFYNDAEKERQALLSEKQRLFTIEQSLKDEGGELQKRYEDIQQAKQLWLLLGLT
jgi:hypothetical protein